MPPSTYIYPKMNKARSYRDEVIRRVELMKTAGALLDVKEYTSRPPSKYAEQFDIDGQYLRDAEAVFVVILSNKTMVTATIVAKDYWYRTIKVSDRAAADDMMAHVDNLLQPLQEFTDERSTRRNS